MYLKFGLAAAAALTIAAAPENLFLIIGISRLARNLSIPIDSFLGVKHSPKMFRRP